MKMKYLFLLAITGFVTSCTSGGSPDIQICRPKLLEFLSIDKNLDVIEVKKSFVGEITKSNSDREELKVGKACGLDVELYQVKGNKSLTVSLTDKTQNLNPFNHYVAATDEAPSCSDPDQSTIRGSYSFTQDSGWHHSYGTKFSLKRLNGKNFELSYSQIEEGHDQSFTCVGEIL